MSHICEWELGFPLFCPGSAHCSVGVKVQEARARLLPLSTQAACWGGPCSLRQARLPSGARVSGQGQQSRGLSAVSLGLWT